MPSADAPHREPPPPSSREQRIEQLLLSGLDQYFAGEFERAIQVWSRVFFLDRGHARARAYIDRARGAIAERQREAEARLHRSDGAAGGGLAEFGLVGSGRVAELCGADAPADGLVARAPSTGITVTALAHAPLSIDLPAKIVDPARVTNGPAAGHDDEPHGRHRPITQILLVALAALLLFGAGYVVAARDRLAAWWTTPSAPALSVPAMAPESGAPRAPDPPAGAAAPRQGTATR